MDKYIKIRFLIFIGIVSLFILGGYLLNTDFTPPPLSDNEMPIRNRSCLGNPIFLPYAFIGFPLLLLAGVLDILILIITKKQTLNKIVVTLLFMLLSFLITFLFPF